MKTHTYAQLKNIESAVVVGKKIKSDIATSDDF